MKGCINWMVDGGGVSKIGLPHIFRGNNYMSKFTFTSVSSKSNKFSVAKLGHYSLSQQNSVKFGTDFTDLATILNKYCSHVHMYLHLW